MKYASCVLILDNDGKVLTVSRKDDANSIGLPGGKCENGESFTHCAIRECFEETGFVVSVDSVNPYVDYDGDYKVRTYLAHIVDGIPQAKTDESETGVVQYRDPVDLLNGDFSEYNSGMLKHFKVSVTKKYLIWYNGVKPETANIIDEIEAHSKIDAIKRFFNVNAKNATFLLVDKVEEIK